jgi:hypothetical protein
MFEKSENLLKKINLTLVFKEFVKLFFKNIVHPKKNTFKN